MALQTATVANEVLLFIDLQTLDQETQAVRSHTGIVIGCHILSRSLAHIVSISLSVD